MFFKGRLKGVIETLTNTHILRTLPHGVDLFYDIKRRLPKYQAVVVFDVGANIGLSAEAVLKWWPGTQIYCFEPVSSNFAALQKRLNRHDNVHCFQLALGASKTRGHMCVEGNPAMYSLIDDRQELLTSWGVQTEEVGIDTLANFCDNTNIERISFLKIDTEGYDLEVLKGAGDMLDRGYIDIIEIEAGMNPRN